MAMQTMSPAGRNPSKAAEIPSKVDAGGSNGNKAMTFTPTQSPKSVAVLPGKV